MTGGTSNELSIVCMAQSIVVFFWTLFFEPFGLPRPRLNFCSLLLLLWWLAEGDLPRLTRKIGDFWLKYCAWGWSVAWVVIVSVATTRVATGDCPAG
jgi:hypothetical protein